MDLYHTADISSGIEVEVQCRVANESQDIYAPKHLKYSFGSLCLVMGCWLHSLF